jgi:hypothetical protein
LNDKDRAIVAAYLDSQLRALRDMQRQRRAREEREDEEQRRKAMSEYVVRPERLETARRVVRERLRVIELDELGKLMEAVEWDHRLYFEGNGVPRLRLADLEMVMLAAALVAVQEMDYATREVAEGELRGARRGEDTALESIPF